MKRRLPTPIRLGLGYFLLFVGFLGFILPILPTWIFVIPGVLLIGEQSKLGIWIHKRMPTKVREIFKKISERFEDT